MASVRLDAEKIIKQKKNCGNCNKVYTRRLKKDTNTAAVAATATSAVDAQQTLASVDVRSHKQNPLVVEASDSSSQNRRSEVVAAASDWPTGNRVVKPVVTFIDDRVKILLKAVSSENEINELREKLIVELDQVRCLVRNLENKEAELTSYSTVAANCEAHSHSQYPGNDMIDDRALPRVNSEMGADYMDRRALVIVNSEVGSKRDQEMRPFRELNTVVVDNGHGVGGFVEKEKRTPKANQYYRNSEFLLGKDRLPPESNKKPKVNGGRKHCRESDYTSRNHDFKSCSNLLKRLMKHKHGWVFNEPVNATMLELPDYHEIIKHPMDLGTIKSRLAQTFYKFPKEFTEDVRQTFRNAMTYNPKGQDVHVMAEQLSYIFEERWAVIESSYNPMMYDVNTPTPTSRKVPPFAIALPRTHDRLEPVTSSFIYGQKPSNFAQVSRTPVPKKPKAKDPNKRNMTYEEKQKLSVNLQKLPSEKLDNIVQIIKKRNTSVSQHDDELEVDIDNVDLETLWELDRFVTNYKKNLSKYKRKAELAQQARAEATNADQLGIESPTSVLDARKGNKADSDNDGSCADGSNAGRSPRS